MKVIESHPVRLLDPSFSVFHYDVELASALTGHVRDLALWAPPVLRDPGYPLPAAMPPIGGLSLHGLTRGSGRLFGRPVQGFDYYLNELYAASALLRRRPLVHIQFLSLFGSAGQRLEKAWFAWLRARAAAIVYTVHDVLPPDRHENLALLQGYERLYHQVDHLIVHTDHQKAHMVERFGIAGARVSVIPHGPLFHRLALPTREHAAAKLGLDPARPYLLHFGHMRPYKGTETLIDAMAIVRGQHPDARLLLAGRAAPDRETALRQRIGRHDLGDAVGCRFDYLPTTELAAYFALADAIVLPYLYIDQSGVLLSALALGIPVVASNVGGMAETIRDEDIGFLCSPGSAEDLALQLAIVLSHLDDARQKAARAKDYALTKLSWSVIAAQTASVYCTLLAS